MTTSPRLTNRRRMLLLAVSLAAALMASTLITTSQLSAQSSEVVVYADQDLEPGFANWSSAPNDLASTSEFYAGSTSIEASMQPGQALFIGNYQLTAAPVGGSLSFWVHAATDVPLAVQVADANGNFGPEAELAAAAAQWTNIIVPLADLGSPATIGRIRIANAGTAGVAPIFFDELRFTTGAPTPATPTALPATPTPDPTPPPDTPPPPTPTPTPGDPGVDGWAFSETFDGDPAAPSQAALPRTFDYMVTHRTHPQHQFDEDFYPSYQADHGEDCAGPDPFADSLPSHTVHTTQTSNGVDIDPSFFICKNHMMSSMGEVDAYSVSAFWPRQEFDFSDGGVLEFDVNINEGHTFRHWWEVMIVPRDQIRMGAGPVDSAIDETYPDDRIVLTWRRNVRGIKVGTGDIAPNGWLVNDEQFGPYDFSYWRDLHPEDAVTDDDALNDRRDRRTMRIQLEQDRIMWGIETLDGGFDEWEADIPAGLPFQQGIVMFKTHSYTPSKDGNTEFTSFHWDNIRFDGPAVAPYTSHWASDVVELQRNGDRPIGDQQTVTVDLGGAVGANPVLVGQLHQPVHGQVLLSVNGGPDTALTLDRYDNGCWSQDWKTFVLPLDPAVLQAGENTLTWTVGPRPVCADVGGPGFNGTGAWDGFSVKGLHIQTG